MDVQVNFFRVTAEIRVACGRKFRNVKRKIKNIEEPRKTKKLWNIRKKSVAHILPLLMGGGGIIRLSIQRQNVWEWSKFIAVTGKENIYFLKEDPQTLHFGCYTK